MLLGHGLRDAILASSRALAIHATPLSVCIHVCARMCARVYVCVCVCVWCIYIHTCIHTQASKFMARHSWPFNINEMKYTKANLKGTTATFINS